MEAFTLDTSGRVECATSFQPVGWCIWSDLTPLAQGAITEALKGVSRPMKVATVRAGNRSFSAPVKQKPLAFRHLSPVTLARIMEDCARFEAVARSVFALHGMSITPDLGRDYWIVRSGRADFRDLGYPPGPRAIFHQAAEADGPLTLSLSPEGSVVHEEVK